VEYGKPDDWFGQEAGFTTTVEENSTEVNIELIVSSF
jgi:hypothetical protein